MILEPHEPTIEAMKKAAEELHDEKKRDYLGASLIGHECAWLRPD